jgi:hypothetical protein
MTIIIYDCCVNIPQSAGAREADYEGYTDIPIYEGHAR